MGPPTLFTIPVLRYMKTYGLSHEQFAMVDGGGALIPVAADRAGITGAKACTTHQEFYCTGFHGGCSGHQAG